jgi:hypothetical protein
MSTEVFDLTVQPFQTAGTEHHAAGQPLIDKTLHAHSDCRRIVISHRHYPL